MPARPIFQSTEYGENYKTRTGAGFTEQLSIVCRKIGINSEGREKLFRRTVRFSARLACRCSFHGVSSERVPENLARSVFS